MKHSSRVIMGKCIICSSMLLLSCVGMVLVAVITKLVFIMLAWFKFGAIEFMWSDIIYAAKLGGAGGAFLGFGWALFYLFKVKGF